MAKQLRVDVAELTDIGRKRAVNQDNLGRRVPDDPDETARDGALFVVADGMGGHAAGEIASTVAVQTICTTYFETASGDVLQGLAQAIKRANEAILTIARESAEHAGMGTTLVAAVLCQGILYVANIGDSRAYLIRNGRMRQLTEDHSWVADQVRAGLLTEDQARNHTHRNVITRSLGTQPNVIADVFVEPAREGDVVLLCSDGLHGYVDDAVIAEVVRSLSPTEAAQKLIALANEAGGPDNITVSIVKVVESPEPTEELLERLQLLSDSPRASRPLPIVAASPAQPSINAPAPPAPLIQTDEPVHITLRRRRRRRTVGLLVRLVAIAALIAFSVAAWDITLGPFAQTRYVSSVVTHDVGKIQQDLATLSTYPPDRQLALLSIDQQQIQSDLALSLTPAEQSQLRGVLNNGILPAVRQAVQAYNAQASIAPLSSASPVSFTLNCATGSLDATGVAALVSVLPQGKPPVTPVLYARDQSGNVAELTLASQEATCGPVLATSVSALSSAGDRLALLIVPTTSGATTPPSFVATLAPGAPKPTTVLPLTTHLAQAQPQAVAMFGTTIALLAQQPGGGSAIYLFSGPKYNPAEPAIVPITQTVRSMAFGGNGLLYLIDASGDLATLDPASQQLHDVGGLHIQPALPVGDPNQYTINTPVPTVSTGVAPATTLNVAALAQTLPLAGTQLAAPDLASGKKKPTPTPTPAPTATPTPAPRTGSSTLLPYAMDVTASQTTPPRVVVPDPRDHRVIVLQGDGVDLDLVQQFADASQLDNVTSAALAPDGHTLYLLTGLSVLQIDLP